LSLPNDGYAELRAHVRIALFDELISEGVQSRTFFLFIIYIRMSVPVWYGSPGQGAMAERSADWMRQAKRDLEMAEKAMESGFFEWTCFIAQQAAEKAVKAVYQSHGGSAIGHGIGSLLRGFEGRVEVPREILKAARMLDGYYIPSRYPDGMAQGTPADHFDREDAGDAIRSAGEVIRFCEDVLA
jgi:HEPN domain-containing protein